MKSEIAKAHSTSWVTTTEVSQRSRCQLGDQLPDQPGVARINPAVGSSNKRLGPRARAPGQCPTASSFLRSARPGTLPRSPPGSPTR